VGRIIGAHGLSGAIRLSPYTDNPNRFIKGEKISVGHHIATIQTIKKLKTNLLVKLDIANDRDTAESLKGLFITVTPDQIPLPPSGSYYHYQIIGLQVLTETGDHIGKITDILETGSNDVYVVSDSKKSELLIPATSEFVLEIKIDSSCMIVKLPEFT
tara:strand:- start:10685 stop:11158 length:474 start_codon:yes stop_codon:yes gene_type:complete